MKNLFACFLMLIVPMGANAQDTFQLAPPLLKYKSVFFTKNTTLDMAFAEPNTQIRYTLNGQEPTGISTLYTRPVRIKERFTTVKARVYGENYKPSDVVEAMFIKDGLPMKSVVGTVPHPKYKGSGATTLMDNQGGLTQISGNTWLGFQNDTVELTVHLGKRQKVNKILVNLLRDYGSWIFLPEKIDFFAFNHATGTFQLLASQTFQQDKHEDGAACVPITIERPGKIKTDTLKIRLHLVKNLPDWHPGKGGKSWIFMDEIKVY